MNPFHPDIFELTRDEPTKKICSFPWYSEVNDEGRLYIKQKMTFFVKTAQFAYIVRINKNEQKTTEQKTFYDESKQGTIPAGTQRCFNVHLTLYGRCFDLVCQLGQIECCFGEFIISRFLYVSTHTLRKNCFKIG